MILLPDRTSALRLWQRLCATLSVAMLLIVWRPAVAPAVQAQPAESSPALELAEAIDDRAVFVDSLLSMMTLREKMGQLAQYPSQWSDTGPSVPAARQEDVREGKVGSFLSLYGAEATHDMQELAVSASRLGIPLLFAYDVVHGYRTIFPIPLAEASSFTPTLARRTARAATREATAGGVHWTFAPMVDLTREPRWGRIMEGAGEDPYLNSMIARAKVKGFQGADVAADTTTPSTSRSGRFTKPTSRRFTRPSTRASAASCPASTRLRGFPCTRMTR